ncbi:MAG TPA: RHS repeat-associated core domain-containing protein [Verrucomicrobiae bacterium]
MGFTQSGSPIAEHTALVGGYVDPWTTTIPEPGYVTYKGTPITWSAGVEAGSGAAWSPAGSMCYPNTTYDVYIWGVSCGGVNGPGFGPVDDNSDGGGNGLGLGQLGCGGGCCILGLDPLSPAGPSGPGDGDGPPPEFFSFGDEPTDDGVGMPVWRVSEPYLSVWLHDEPLGYQPSLGSRVALNLAYKQRESTSGMIPDLFGVGMKWNCSWLCYVTMDALGVNTIIHYPNGMTTTVPGSIDYATNVRLAGNMTNGYTIIYPDGSSDVFKCIVRGLNLFYQPIAFRTQHLSPQSQPTTFNYLTNSSPFGSVVRLTTVVDASGGTNVITYASTNAFSTNLISQVTDPYGRTVQFSYNTNGCLTNIVDVAGISTSLLYDANVYVTNLTTPYGTTSFSVTDGPSTNAAPIGRSVCVTDPDGSSELFLSRDLAPGVPSSYGSSGIPNTGAMANLFDTTNLNVRNTFHWNKKQYSNLSTTNISSLTSNDFRLAGMKHWLLTANSQIGQTLSMQRDPSPDNLGLIEGQKTWYDYAGKTNFQYEGTQFLPLITARIVPDGTTSLTYQARNAAGSVTTNISTFGIGASTGLRTNVLSYGTNLVDLYTVTNALNVREVSNTFNAYHQIITTYDALNQPTSFAYDTNQRMASVTLATGLVITNLYGSDGFLAQQIKVGISTNLYTYTNGLVSTHTTTLGLTTSNTWDNLQRLTSQKFPDGTFVSNQYTRLDRTATKDRLGNWSHFGYDQLRHRVAATNALGAYAIYTYCSCGAIEETRDTLGNLTYFNYDNQIRRISTLCADGYNFTNNYDLAGRITNTIDSSGLSVTNWFNNQGLPVASSNAFGQVLSRGIDILDRVTNAVDQNGVVVASTYDALNRLLTRSYPDGGIERYGYSAGGLVACTNQLTNVTYYGLDTASRKVAETNALGYTTKFAYDGAGDLLSLTDPNNSRTTWGYDSYGRVTNEVDATGAAIFTYAYDAAGRLTNRWSVGKGNTGYTYDSVGNLTGAMHPNSPSVSYLYNAMNWLTQMSDGIGTTTFAYDPSGHLASEGGLWANDTVSYTYANRRRASLALQQPTSSPWAQNYSYDRSQRLNSTSSQAGTFNFSYSTSPGGKISSSSLLTQTTLPNGAYISNTYDTFGRVTTNCLFNSGGTALDCYNYTYDVGNQRTTLRRNNENSVGYTYDAIGQVVGDQASEVSGGSARLNEQLHYAFDPVGNLAYRTNNALIENFRFNSVNEITNNTNGGTLTVLGTTTSPATSVAVNGITASMYGDSTFAAAGLPLTSSYTATASDSLGRHSTNTVNVTVATNVLFHYDANGNLTNDGLRNFVYDDENELVQASVSNAWMSQFQYDGKMRRRIRKEFTWQGGAWLQTNAVYYIYDGDLVVQERDANNMPMVTYTRGNDLSGTRQGDGGVGGLLARTSAAYSGAALSGQAYYHSDANGNVTMLLDDYQGVVAKYLYDAFGNVLAKSGMLADANVYRFSSKEWHQNSGLVYYLYRYYDPHLQRWLNRDPFMENGGIDLYTFVANDPAILIDSWGLDQSLYFFGHMWIQVDTPNGPVALNFAPQPSGSDYTIMNPKDIPYPHCKISTKHTSPTEDQKLLNYWQHLANDPNSRQWSLTYNCISCSLNTMSQTFSPTAPPYSGGPVNAPVSLK